jgi:hypothetical protein
MQVIRLNYVYKIIKCNKGFLTGLSLLTDNEVRKWSRMQIINLTVDMKIISEVENNTKTEFTMAGPLTWVILKLWGKEGGRETYECTQYSDKINFKISEWSYKQVKGILVKQEH